MPIPSSALPRQAARIAVALAALTLAACSVERVEPVDDYRPRPRPVCTREYAPVCGARGGERQTFANACEARLSGYDILARGECRIGRPDRDEWREGDRERDRSRRERRDRGDDERPRDRRVCTADYAPVCAARDGTDRVFANTCEAERAGFRVWKTGPCPVR